jgi:hypothetical protein
MRIRDVAVQGTAAKGNSLQAARPRGHISSDTSGGGLFVTQVRPGTHYSALKDHIFAKTGLRLKCSSLRSRNDHLYSLFRVICNETELARLLSRSLWPRGIFIKKFEQRQSH